MVIDKWTKIEMVTGPCIPYQSLTWWAIAWYNGWQMVDPPLGQKYILKYSEVLGLKYYQTKL